MLSSRDIGIRPFSNTSLCHYGSLASNSWSLVIYAFRLFLLHAINFWYVYPQPSEGLPPLPSLVPHVLYIKLIWHCVIWWTCYPGAFLRSYTLQAFLTSAMSQLLQMDVLCCTCYRIQISRTTVTVDISKVSIKGILDRTQCHFKISFFEHDLND